MDSDLLTAIAEAVGKQPDAASLRARFPGIVFTECSEDDIPARARPVAEVGAYALYLVGSPDGHCLSLTADMEAAHGVVVARREDEE